MPQITIKETITKKIEIPMDVLYEFIDNLYNEQELIKDYQHDSVSERSA